jgi:hypothetical protein
VVWSFSPSTDPAPNPTKQLAKSIHSFRVEGPLTAIFSRTANVIARSPIGSRSGSWAHESCRADREIGREGAKPDGRDALCGSVPERPVGVRTRTNTGETARAHQIKRANPENARHNPCFSK